MNAHSMQSIEAGACAPPVQVGAPKMDVLAVLRQTDDHLQSLQHYASSHALREAITDVAELIEANRRVSSHLEKAIEFIEKAYPDARQLDRGPIIRNMRRWRDRLQVALARIGGAA